MIKDVIPVNFDKLQTIHHCADIHIRNVKRHNEYREVFERFYKEVEKEKENAIIVVAGDIVHAKLEMSPELIDLTFEFFKRLAEIMPTIVITGNHDCNLNNLSRLDVISPIIKNIDNPNLFYLKHSGIYDVADTKLVVMSVFQDPADYIKADNVDGDTKIAIYHGTVDQAKSETGFSLHNDKVTTAMFTGYDITLLGDIHKRQALAKTVQYPGSLIQQNFGEDLEHGFIKWNVPKRVSKFIPLKNDYAFITLNITDGQMPDIKELHAKSRIRLMIKNTPPSRLTEIITSIREKYPKVQDINNVKIPDGSILDGVNVNKVNIGDARDVSFQNTIIEEFLVSHFSLEKEVIDQIFDINTRLNTMLKPVDSHRNIVWKAKKFNWDNMFSYGKGNSIDFEKCKGIVGLFAPNRQGKSNFIESLCFTLFDKSPRALKSESAMNNKKNTFDAKMLYDIGDKEFQIKRNAHRTKKGSVVVKTDFSVKDAAGRKSLNGERRSSTNLMMRNYLGDYDSFIMTALVPQIDLHKGTNANLINMRQTDRKNLLSRFLDLTVFHELYELARDEMRAVDVKLSNFGKREFSKELAHSNIQIKLLSKEYEEKTTKKNEFDALYKNVNKEINNLTSKLIKIDIANTDLPGLENAKEQCEEDCKSLDVKLTQIDDRILGLEDLIQTTERDLNEIDDSIEQKYQVVKEIEKQKDDVKHNVEKYQIKIDTKKEQLGDFAELTFNDDCNNCHDNKIVIEDKMDVEDDVMENETILETLKTQIDNFDTMLETAKDVRDKYKTFISLKESLRNYKSDLSITKNDFFREDKKLDEYKRKLDKIKKNINEYHKNEKTIEKNNEIQKEIDEWNDKSLVIEDAIDNITKEIMDIYSNIEVHKTKKERIENEIEEVKKLEIEAVAYRHYMEAVEKDGVPFDLIVKTMPIIQHEVNNILAQMVDFQINFEIDEVGKDIEPKIMYEGENAWAVELVSGMERFIASIAIRVALLSVSSLPRPNFLIIDEGWGSLDSDNANNIYRLFDYLKNQFDFVLIISHLDYIKDMADQLIELKNENGFSKIVY